MLPCLKTERVSLSPQFTSCSKKATIEQSEDEIEELSKIILEDIHHDVNIRGQFSISICIDCFLAIWYKSVAVLLDLWTEVKHPDYLSSSQQVSSDTEDVGSSQSSLELPGMVRTELFISLPNKLGSSLHRYCYVILSWFCEFSFGLDFSCSFLCYCLANLPKTWQNWLHVSCLGCFSKETWGTGPGTWKMWTWSGKCNCGMCCR